MLGLPIHSSLQLSHDRCRQPSCRRPSPTLRARVQSGKLPKPSRAVRRRLAAAMHPGRQGHRGGVAADADFVGTGFALVLSAVSYLLLVLVDGGGGGQPASTPGMEWQVILAFGAMAGGLLLIMHGIRARGARPPVLVRRVAGAAGAVLWHAGGPERLLPVLALLLLPFLEAWFDFF